MPCDDRGSGERIRAGYGTDHRYISARAATASDSTRATPSGGRRDLPVLRQPAGQGHIMGKILRRCCKQGGKSSQGDERQGRQDKPELPDERAEPPDFRAGECDTGFIADNPELLNVQPKQDKELKVLTFLGEKYVNGNKGIKPNFNVPVIPEDQGRRMWRTQGNQAAAG